MTANRKMVLKWMICKKLLKTRMRQNYSSWLIGLTPFNAIGG